MNTNDLKYFGQEARKLLMAGVNRKLAFWGFDNEGNTLEEPTSIHGGYIFRGVVYDDATLPVKWNKLQEAVKQNGFNEIVEKAAYVWFNRFIALQILGKNEYDLPQLEPVNIDEATPQILKRARQGEYGFLNPEEQNRLQKILTDYENETQAFAILLIGYCHHHTLINNVFGGIDDYTELLLPDDILATGGFLDFLNNGGHITDEDFTKVELVGWLYQFYISVKKEEVSLKFKANEKAKKEDIPAATQIFTPNWIVKYMVENTVGRIWLDLHPHSPIRETMKYLVEPAVQTGEQSDAIISEVKELKLLDPAVGSGHILVEGFELLYDMYIEELYPADEAVESILQHNLFGIDIDVRAAQLAQFAVLMKAAQKYPGILQRNVIPHIYAMPDPVAFSKEDILLFLGEDGKPYLKPIQDALHLMLKAQNLGAIMQFNISQEARTYIVTQLNQWQKRTNLDLLEQELLYKLVPYLIILEVLTKQYDAIAANPPYMSCDNMNTELISYISEKYPVAKEDFMTTFIQVASEKVKKNGYIGIITLQSWMFIDAFILFRQWLIGQLLIKSLIQFGRGVFGSDFGSVAFIAKKDDNLLEEGLFFKLYELGQISKVSSVPELRERFFKTKPFRRWQKSFEEMPKYQIAAGLPLNAVKLFNDAKLDVFGKFRRGIGTSDNDRFIKVWHEVNLNNSSILELNLNNKWFKYNKGGEFKKWYGNHQYVVNWENDGKEIRNLRNKNGKLLSRPQNIEYNFKENISYTSLTISKTSHRYYPKGFINDQAGNFLYLKDGSELKYILAFLNSKVAAYLLENINPTVNILVEDLNKLPLNKLFEDEVLELTEKCVEISKKDWDSRETSWEFQQHPLLTTISNTIQASYYLWAQQVSNEVLQLQTAEIELNKIFIQIYALQDELNPNVTIREITILQEELDYNYLNESKSNLYLENTLPIKKDVVIQQLISYALGCFFGRYRLDKVGLQIAHTNPTSDETTPYSYNSPVTNHTLIFNIDEDAIIPLMGKKSIFTDDAIKRFQEFVQIIWGDETLTQNLNFVQEFLNREVEDYLVNYFWKYHVKMYSKKPIYWLFASKKNAFQVLVYMHRMNRFTVEKIRDKYLLKHIQHLKQQIQSLETKGGALTREEQKKLDQLRTDELECSEYELILKDVATQQIEFDLDDGVTKNYALFQKVVAPIK